MVTRRPARRTEVTPLEAGSFAAWRDRLLAALDDPAGEMDVPCGDCTACCRSSMFVHLAPDEVSTLRRIPPALLVPAPGAPTGHVVLGFDERGRCPMLGEHGCSIYDDRPRTCRVFDCRVLAAASVEPEGKPALAEQARRWRFSPESAADSDARALVAAAAATARRDGLDGLALAIAACRARPEG